tara:strand:- start:406 stop:696 length:291 start_codon:yes stop_codon:yes gene_type:complete
MSDKNKTMKILLDDDPSEGETMTLALNLVDHPAHYNQGNYETIDVIEDWGLDFNCGNAVKYISRHMHKGTAIRDIEKAIWYLKRRLDTLKRGERND